MKILHLFSNWKWTGPAEPAVNLCRTLARRHEVVFIPGGHPRPFEDNEVATEALARGVEPVEGFMLEKHFHPLHNIEDIMKLRAFLQERKFDIIHTHMTNDHFIAAVARRTLRSRSRIVRTYYDADGLVDGMRARWLLRHSTKAAIVISERARASILDAKALRPERVTVIPGAVDTERFDPGAVNRAAARADMGLGADDFVFVIVARMQRHRKFEVLLRAFRKVSAKDPALRLVIIGRGTHQEEVARTPARELGLDDKVVFAGYRSGRNFVSTIGSADCALFLIPGSDESCRAVREKMSMGLPVIASRMPPLDEMNDDGRNGFLSELTEEGLAAAMLRAAGDRARTRAMGEAARQKALAEYSLDAQARSVEACYRRVLGKEEEL
jgi:glycosyltransferase involved in cell wall biosynthesis